MKIRTIVCTAALALAVTFAPMSANAAPEVMPDGTIFDAEYYAANNPDVVAALGTSTQALYSHYVAFGSREGRLPVAPQSAFDAAYYAKRYPDVVAALGNSPAMMLAHYNVCGQKEGRFPNAAAEAAATGAKTATTTTTTTTTTVKDYSSMTQAEISEYVCNLVNQQRVNENRTRLEWSPGMLNASFTRAQELLEKNSHQRPNNTMYETALIGDRIEYTAAGECKILGLQTAEEAVRYWMREGEDRNVLLSNDYTKICAGYDSRGGGSWVVLLIKPAE